MDKTTRTEFEHAFAILKTIADNTVNNEMNSMLDKQFSEIYSGLRTVQIALQLDDDKVSDLQNDNYVQNRVEQLNVDSLLLVLAWKMKAKGQRPNDIIDWIRETVNNWDRDMRTVDSATIGMIINVFSD